MVLADLGSRRSVDRRLAGNQPLVNENADQQHRPLRSAVLLKQARPFDPVSLND
jgi:hypothetical protein